MTLLRFKEIPWPFSTHTTQPYTCKGPMAYIQNITFYVGPECHRMVCSISHWHFKRHTCFVHVWLLWAWKSVTFKFHDFSKFSHESIEPHVLEHKHYSTLHVLLYGYNLLKCDSRELKILLNEQSECSEYVQKNNKTHRTVQQVSVQYSSGHTTTIALYTGCYHS